MQWRTISLLTNQHLGLLRVCRAQSHPGLQQIHKAVQRGLSFIEPYSILQTFPLSHLLAISVHCAELAAMPESVSDGVFQYSEMPKSMAPRPQETAQCRNYESLGRLPP